MMCRPRRWELRENLVRPALDRASGRAFRGANNVETMLD